MDWLVQFATDVMSNKTYATILGLIAAIAPLYFLKTLYSVWFGPEEEFIGFRAQRSTWLVLATVDAIGLFTLLPAGKDALVMQIVMLMWTIEMYLVFGATIFRKVRNKSTG